MDQLESAIWSLLFRSGRMVITYISSVSFLLLCSVCYFLNNIMHSSASALWDSIDYAHIQFFFWKNFQFFKWVSPSAKWYGDYFWVFAEGVHREIKSCILITGPSFAQVTYTFSNLTSPLCILHFFRGAIYFTFKRCCWL